MSSSLVRVLKSLSQENAENMVNLINTGGKISNISQDVKISQTFSIPSGVVKKLKCKVKDFSFNNFNKPVMFSP